MQLLAAYKIGASKSSLTLQPNRGRGDKLELYIDRSLEMVSLWKSLFHDTREGPNPDVGLPMRVR